MLEYRDRTFLSTTAVARSWSSTTAPYARLKVVNVSPGTSATQLRKIKSYLRLLLSARAAAYLKSGVVDGWAARRSSVEAATSI
jgi:hypothetical protein